MILIAVDVQVSRRAFPYLERARLDVFEAGTGEPDAIWFAAARRAGARAVVSPDDDLRRLCLRYGVPWVRLPGEGVHWFGQVDTILTAAARFGLISRGAAARVVDAARERYRQCMASRSSAR